MWCHHDAMDLTPYVDALRVQLSVAGGIGGPDTVAVAEKLADALDGAARLAIQQAICDAAEQITRDLAPGAVEVRLRAHELDFATTLPSLPDRDVGMTSPGPLLTSQPRGSDGTDGGETGTARISFRPPEHLKARIEEAAERVGLSVNAFLVATLTAALDSPPATGQGQSRGGSVTGWFA
jgi:hypothetical protein